MAERSEIFVPRLRFLDPRFENERFNDDGVETQTSKEQKEVENSVATCYRIARNIVDTDPGCPYLKRDEHAKFLKKGLRSLPFLMEPLDSSRTWLCFWILHALELLDEHVKDETKLQVVGFLKLCQHPDGGFGGGPGQEPHLATTYSAVNALCILKCVEAYEIIDRPKLLSFLLKLKKPDGSFMMHQSSESDIRGVYCALSIARLTNILVPELTTGTAEWVASCQTYEGGFGGVPFMEAHGGYTFCGYAALVLMDKENMCNINNLLRWLVNRQMRYEGGFQGRTNKLVDSCYSFWQGAVFPLLHRKLCKTERDTMSTDSWLFNQGALQEYILANCQCSGGGIIDKPGKKRDFYHIAYALSGLSIAQHFAGGQLGKTCLVGDPDNELVPTHPVYNICVDSAIQASQYFSSQPVPSCKAPSAET